MFSDYVFLLTEALDAIYVIDSNPPTATHHDVALVEGGCTYGR